MRKHLTPGRLWTAFFALWAVFLSGALKPFVGSPGVIQAAQTYYWLKSKETQLSKLEDEVIRLQAEAEKLEKNKLVQHREIRRILGYAAPDELVFDFSAGDSI
jgi:cell division protein FtsB